MRATAIVPVKRFGAAKQRLSDVLAPEQRAALAAAMLSDVLEALAEAKLVERVLVVSGEPRVAELLAGRDADLLEHPEHVVVDNTDTRQVVERAKPLDHRDAVSGAAEQDGGEHAGRSVSAYRDVVHINPK